MVLKIYVWTNSPLKRYKLLQRVSFRLRRKIYPYKNGNWWFEIDSFNKIIKNYRFRKRTNKRKNNLYMPNERNNNLIRCCKYSWNGKTQKKNWKKEIKNKNIKIIITQKAKWSYSWKADLCRDQSLKYRLCRNIFQY